MLGQAQRDESCAFPPFPQSARKGWGTQMQAILKDAAAVLWGVQAREWLLEPELPRELLRALAEEQLAQVVHSGQACRELPVLRELSLDQFQPQCRAAYPERRREPCCREPQNQVRQGALDGGAFHRDRPFRGGWVARAGQ